jgi:hypothetical protein
MPKESKEDRLEKLLVVMERYFEELNEEDYPSRRPPSGSHSITKEVKGLISVYKTRKEFLSGPDLKDVAAMLAESAKAAHALMLKSTSWAAERAAPRQSKRSY